MLAVVSVSSTGSTADRIERGLSETVGAAWRLEPLVGRGSHGMATSVPTEEVTGRQAAWLCFKDLEEPDGDPARCVWCKDSSTARVVPISPRNFAALGQTEPTLRPPDPLDGRRNVRLWEAYQAANAIGASALRPLNPSFMRPLRRRPGDRNTDLAVYFEPAALLTEELRRAHVGRRIGDMRAGVTLPMESQIAGALAKGLEGHARCSTWVIDREDADALVMYAEGCDEEQAAEPGRRQRVLDSMVADLSSYLDAAGSPRWVVVDRLDSMKLDRLRDELRTEDPHVLLFTSGVRRGTTLQRLLVDVQEAWRDIPGEPIVHALVVHAHPSDPLVWTNLRYAFSSGRKQDSRLVALWLSFIPERRSPVGEELLTLNRVPRDDVEAALSPSAFRRFRSLVGVDPTRQWVWSPNDVSLRRTSLYGDRLGAQPTLAAVGAAMQSARVAAQPIGGPHWFEFDLPKIFRTYFDGLIHAAALRWIHPREGWWGPEGTDCVSLLQEIGAQAPEDWKFLLPELCLAGAQGKVPIEGMIHLLSECREIIDNDAWERDHLDFLEIGRFLVRDALLPEEAARATTS